MREKTHIIPYNQTMKTPIKIFEKRTPSWTMTSKDGVLDQLNTIQIESKLSMGKVFVLTPVLENKNDIPEINIKLEGICVKIANPYPIFTK